MKKYFIALITLAALAGSANGAAPSPSPDILMVNVTEVYNNYYRAQEAQEKLQAVIDAAQTELNKMMEEGMAVAKSLEEIQTKLNSPALKEDVKQRLMEEAKPKAEELQKKEVEINQFRQEKQAQFNERRQSMFNTYLSEIGDAASALAKKKGAKYIMNANSMVYAMPGADITDELIKSLNLEKDKLTADNKKATPVTKEEKKK